MKPFKRRSWTRVKPKPKGSYSTIRAAQFIKKQIVIPHQKDDMKFLQKGFFGEFARNPAGTMIGLLMFYLMIDFLASPVGPFAGTGIDTEMGFIYTNSSWLLTFAFVMLPVAIAYGFATGNVGLKRAPKVPEIEEEEDSDFQVKDGVGDSSS